MPVPLAVTKIALWKTVGDAYEIVFANPGRFLLTAGAWLIALTALTALFMFAPTPFPFASVLPAILRIGEMLGEALLSFAWLRSVLSDERPRALPRLGRRELRFVAYAILVIAIVRGVLFFGGSLLVVFLSLTVVLYHLAPLTRSVTDPLQIIALVVLLIPVAGVLLALPALAEDEHDAVLSRAWQRARGNGIQLAFGVMLCLAPFEGIKVVIEKALGVPVWQLWIAVQEGRKVIPARTPLQVMAATELDLLLSFLGAAITVGFLALAYRQLAVNGATEDSVLAP
jgi:hypothetical protein